MKFSDSLHGFRALLDSSPSLPIDGHSRHTLKQAGLDYVFARVDLLGGK